MPITTMQIKLTSGQIKEAKVLPDGICELLIEVKKNESQPPIPDSDLVLIDAENLSMKDKFMQHEPKNELEKEKKELIAEAIKKGVKNFWKPIRDVSIAKDGNGICYPDRKERLEVRFYDWHEKAAKKFWPERNSRLGSILEFGAFLGVLIKKLVEEGKQ